MRSYASGQAYAKSEHQNPSQNWHNKCQMFARSCVGAAAWAPSARQAANAIPQKYRHTNTPPPGALVYYGSSSSGYGHVTYMSEGGKCWSNDLVRDGKIDLVDWKRPVHQWGLAYRFWTDWTPSGRVNLKPAAPNPVPKPVPAKPAAKAPFPGKFGPSTKPTAAVIAATKEIQKHFKLKVDGVFGPATKAAVVAYQKRHPYLAPWDGIVGRRTYKSIVGV